MAILTEATKYKADHGNKKFVRPQRLPLYNNTITNDATTVVRVRSEASHKSRLDDYASYEAAKRGVAKFLRDVVDKIWYNNLEDADLFYTKVTAIDIRALLDANSGGLHAVDMITLHTNMCRSPDSCYEYQYSPSILAMVRPCPDQSHSLANTT